MNKQPEALRLADILEKMPLGECDHQAAAELRRLHAEVERLSWDSIHTCHSECRRPLCKLTRERDALLEALKTLVLATKDFSIGHYNEEVHDIALSKARAAIATVEGEKP